MAKSKKNIELEVTKAREKKSVKKGRSRERRKLIIFTNILMTATMIVMILMLTAMVFWSIGPADNVELKFSKPTGLYQNEIAVEIDAKEIVLGPVAEIRYTINGDDPAKVGQRYTGQIKLPMRDTVNVYPIKAAYCYIGGNCSKVFEATYILSENPEDYITLDLISITTDHDNLYDYEKGIFVRGKVYDDEIAKGAEEGVIAGNYMMRGDEWIRNANIVRLDTDGKIAWDQNIGIQVSGGSSSAQDVKSLKLIANHKYGYDKLRYSFDDSGSSTVGLAIPKTYNSLRLRSGGQDIVSGNIRSSVASRLAEEGGFDGYSATKRAVVYINGEFYGIFDVMQNFSDSFLRKRFSLAESDDIIKIKGEEVDVLAEAGVNNLFEKDLNVAKNREKLEQMVDMDNYLRYYALQILWNNTDWPGNNYEMWRYNGAKVAGNKYSDGRWRFLIYDVDTIYFGEENEIYFEGVVGDQFRALMEDKYKGEGSSFKNVISSDYYREKFLIIINELLDSTFKLDNVLEVVDEEKDKIAPAMYYYYSEKEYEEWEHQIDLMKRAVREQSEQIRGDIAEFLGE